MLHYFQHGHFKKYGAVILKAINWGWRRYPICETCWELDRPGSILAFKKKVHNRGQCPKVDGNYTCRGRSFGGQPYAECGFPEQLIVE